MATFDPHESYVSRRQLPARMSITPSVVKPTGEIWLKNGGRVNGS